MQFIFPIAVIACIAVIYATWQRATRNWRATTASRDVVATDGKFIAAGDMVWTRRKNGKWEYRAMTVDEVEHELWMTAIR